MSGSVETSREMVPTAAGTASTRRYGFVDLLRGVALVVMIETHVVNAYLPFDSRHSSFFFWLTFLNGLVAPTFLFATGFSLILQMDRKWSEWLRFGPAFWTNARRLGFITLVAYYTHLQHFKLSKYLRDDEPNLWKDTLQVDILQCIVASLLIVQLVAFLVRTRTVFVWSALVLAGAVAAATPLVWSRDFTSQLPLALALFFNPHGSSLFPLFPWICFVLAGSIAANFFLRAAQSGVESHQVWKFLAAGVVFILAGSLLRKVPLTLPGMNFFYTTSPLYVLIRLGCVLICCAALYAMEKTQISLPGAVRTAGQESLLVYGVHLWLIFGVLRGKHLAPLLGTEAGYVACFFVSAALIAFMLWLAGRWQSLKKNYRWQTKRAQTAVVMLMVLVFLLR